MAADKCKENEGSLTGEDLEIFRAEYVDKEIKRIYPNLSPHLPRKQKLHLNVFNGEDLEIAIDKAIQWQKEQMMKDAIDAHVNMEWNHLSLGGFAWSQTGLDLGDKCKLIIIKE